MKYIGLKVSIIAILSLPSCGTPQYVAGKNDSTVVIKEVVYKDSLIYVPVPAEVESNVADDSSHLETSVAVSDAWWQAGKLHHRLRNKTTSLPYRFAIPETKVTTLKQNLNTVVMEVEKDLSWMQKCMMTLGKIFCGVILAAVGWFLLRK